MKKQLSVALFSDSAIPILNGVSISIQALVHELRRMGHSVHVFTSGYPKYKEEDPNVHRFFSTLTPLAPGYPLAMPPFGPFLREFAVAEFDLVHTHTPFTVGTVGLAWARMHKIPVVATYHTQYDKYTHYVPLVPKKLVRGIIARHTHHYYNAVDQVITPSHSSLRWLERHEVTTPTTIIPTGIPLPRNLNQVESRKELRIDGRSKVVLYAGRIAREKNITTLIQAMSLAMRKDSDLQLLIVGDGPARNEYLALCRTLGIGDRCRFAGFVPRQQVDVFYAAADVFAFPSMTETQGLVVAEAMSYGLPPVVVRFGGAGEQVEDGVNGFLCRNDPAEMASDILSLFQDERIYAKLSAGAKATAARLTIPAMANQVLEVYHTALGDAPSKEDSTTQALNDFFR